MKNLFFLSIYFASYSVCLAKIQTIRLLLNHDCNLMSVKLYKYNNAFDQEFISSASSVNGEMSFKKDLSEVDAYMLQDPLSKQFVRFIWDGNLVMNVNCQKFSSSTIKNSYLTNELQNVNDSIVKLYIEPIKILDSLISKCSSSNSADCMNIRSKRNVLFTENKYKIRDYQLNYSSTHPSSFVSLYLLTYTGLEDHSPNLINTFKKLSTELKMHSRGKIYSSN